jgi:hypothetical protein
MKSEHPALRLAFEEIEHTKSELEKYNSPYERHIRGYQMLYNESDKTDLDKQDIKAKLSRFYQTIVGDTYKSTIAALTEKYPDTVYEEVRAAIEEELNAVMSKIYTDIIR